MTEPRSYRVEAVVLRHADWGEADRLLTLYSLQRGKLRALAKGARRIRSRKAGHLEPFTRVSLQMARGRDLPIITQVETIDAYLPVRDDLGRTVRASQVVEMLDRFTYEDAIESAPIYHLLTSALSRIATEPDPWLALRYYEVHLLEQLGFRPRLFECANCEQDVLAQEQFFSPRAGGVLCPRCGAGLPGAWNVSVPVLKFLRHFQRSTYSDAQRAHPEPQVREELEALLQKYITYLLERELNSPGFMRQIEK